MLVALLICCQELLAIASDCMGMIPGEKFTGVRYSARLVENEVSDSEWAILFNGCGFTKDGEYQPHFLDMMIKAESHEYDDATCVSGFPLHRRTWNDFGFQYSLTDYEEQTGHDNDIAARTRDPKFFPRLFCNIDSKEPAAPDIIVTEYQIAKGGSLWGRDIEIILEREKSSTRIPSGENLFMDPDGVGGPVGRSAAQADIDYTHWVATFRCPSLKVEQKTDFFVNAKQGEFIRGEHLFNLMFENPFRVKPERDRFKVIMYDFQAKPERGSKWKPVTRFYADYRSPAADLPLDKDGRLIGGYRKVLYRGKPAIESSFGYGYTDYVRDEDIEKQAADESGKALIDLGNARGAAEASGPWALAALKRPAAAAASEVTLRPELVVEATDGWADTQLEFVAGETLQINRMGGLWTVAAGMEPFSANGNPTYPEGFKTYAVLPEAPMGCLLGRIDGGRPFFLGEGKPVRIPSSGRLSVRINDRNTALKDNSGNLRIGILLKKPAE